MYDIENCQYKNVEWFCKNLAYAKGLTVLSLSTISVNCSYSRFKFRERLWRIATGLWWDVNSGHRGKSHFPLLFLHRHWILALDVDFKGQNCLVWMYLVGTLGGLKTETRVGGVKGSISSSQLPRMVKSRSRLWLSPRIHGAIATYTSLVQSCFFFITWSRI